MWFSHGCSGSSASDGDIADNGGGIDGVGNYGGGSGCCCMVLVMVVIVIVFGGGSDTGGGVGGGGCDDVINVNEWVVRIAGICYVLIVLLLTFRRTLALPARWPAELAI